jgi:glycosyltransferase involved in cell wall biosynthesis
MNEFKTVSVIVPIYNVEKHIEKCIDSIINQSYSKIEVIMVNDGSTDNSRKMIDKYNGDSRCKILDKKNGGASSARNLGLENSIGEYIFFVDSDDYLHKEAVRLLVEKMDTSGADFCCYRICFYSEDNQIKFLHGKNFCVEILDEKNEIIKDALLGVNIKTSPWSKLYRRSFIEENHLRFVEGIINEDSLYTIESAVYSRKVAFLNIPLYYALIRQGSISRNIKKEILTSYFTVYERIKSVLEKENLFNNFEKYFHAGYFKDLLNILLQIAIKVPQKKYFIDLYRGLNGTPYLTKKKYAKYIMYKSKYFYIIYLLSLFPSLFYFFFFFYKRINNRIYY